MSFSQLLKLKGKTKPRILFMDTKAIIISKPSGIVSQLPGAQVALSGEDDSLENFLDDITFKLGDDFRPVPVHRLDKVINWTAIFFVLAHPELPATTGTLLLARSADAVKSFSQQFSSREVQKTYLALVRAGRETFPNTSGDINVKLEADRTGKTRVSTTKTGTETCTRWQWLGSSPKAPVSLLKLHLHTGFKHQLRAHLSHILKAPVLGDKLHSQSILSAKIRAVAKIPTDRLFLHASHISFFRYRKMAPRRYVVGVSAPLPEDFAQLCHDLDLHVDDEYLKELVTVNEEHAPADLQNFEEWWQTHRPTLAKLKS